MTLEAPSTGSSDSNVCWRMLTEGLWVGRIDDRHIGMIEHGHDYLFITAEGAPAGRYPTLAAAQDAIGSRVPEENSATPLSLVSNPLPPILLAAGTLLSALLIALYASGITAI